MARTVDDVALLLSVMAGPDIGDPNGHPVPLERGGGRRAAGGGRRGASGVGEHVGQGFSPADGHGQGPRAWASMRGGLQPCDGAHVGQGFSPADGRPRIGWFADDGRTPVEPAISDAVRRAAAALSAAGFEVVPFRPEGLDEARELWWDIFGRASRLLLEPLVAGREAEVHGEPASSSWSGRGGCRS